MTPEQAQQYFNSVPAEEQQRIRASGADVTAWANASENAGDPRALRYSGAQQIEGGGGYQASGQGAPTTEWLGKRKPTPAELVQYYRESGKSEDFARYSAGQVAAWINDKWDVAGAHFVNDFGDVVEKPTESGPRSQAAGYTTGEQSAGTRGGGGGGGGGMGGPGGGWYGGGTTGFGGAPAFNYTPFKPPLPGDTTTDPSYLFRLEEGRKALERSASARGVLRTSGTLKDILDYGQNAASQEYQNIFNRGAQTYGLQYQGQKDAFAPVYGSWETTYGGDLAKYLQKEGNIFNLLNQPPPPYYG